MINFFYWSSFLYALSVMRSLSFDEYKLRDSISNGSSLLLIEIDSAVSKEEFKTSDSSRL